MMQAGRYHGRLKSATTTEAKTGTAQMALVFTVSHVQAGQNWAPIPEQDRTVYVALTDKAWETSEQKLKLLGFNGDFAKPVMAETVYAEGVELDCNIEPYNGKDRERWELVGWGGGYQPAAAKSDVLRQLSAKWKAKTAPRSAAPAGRPAVTSAAPKTTPAPKSAPAPAPAATTPGAATATLPDNVPTTRDQAWAHITAAHAERKLTQAQLEARWAKEIESHAAKAGKPEAEFNADDWYSVAVSGEIPF